MAQTPPPDQEFHTWAEIAGYLDISPREAQNREKNQGLPVYRLPGKKSRVWARRSELDSWKAKMAIANHAPVVASPPRKLSRRWVLASVGGALAASAGAIAVVSRAASKGPTRAAFQGNSICAWDETGRMLWSFPFPQPLVPDTWGPFVKDRQIAMVDFDGTGHSHIMVILAVRKSDGFDRDEVYCFSPQGKVLWRYRPQIKVTFGDTAFSGPWLAEDMIVVPDKSGGSAVWLSYNHLDYRPCVLVSLVRTGVSTIQFVNTGHIYKLHYTTNSGGGYLLAGGLNNEYDKACLAILRVGTPPSQSPQSAGTRFECVDGPKGLPLRYFLFPQTDVSHAAGEPYNRVRHIYEFGSQVIVQAFEDGPGEAIVMYRFSGDLEPTDLILGDGFGVLHRRLQDQGLIKHDLAQCPHLTAPTILDRWDSQSGWTEVSVPPNGSVKPGSLR